MKTSQSSMISQNTKSEGLAVVNEIGLHGWTLALGGI